MGISEFKAMYGRDSDYSAVCGEFRLMFSYRLEWYINSRMTEIVWYMIMMIVLIVFVTILITYYT